MTRLGGRAALLAALMVGGATTGEAQAAKEAPVKAADVTITRTAQSIPNIVAKDFAGGGYGVGYAMAEDNVCATTSARATAAGATRCTAARARSGCSTT